MSVTIQFTEKDFLYYKREVLRLVKKHGITEWDITFVFGIHSDADLDALVATRGNFEAMACTMYFPRTLTSDDILTMSKDKLIEKCAKHEVAEVLTIPLQVLCARREYDSKIVESENHRLVHRIENLL